MVWFGNSQMGNITQGLGHCGCGRPKSKRNPNCCGASQSTVLGAIQRGKTRYTNARAKRMKAGNLGYPGQSYVDRGKESLTNANNKLAKLYESEYRDHAALVRLNKNHSAEYERYNSQLLAEQRVLQGQYDVLTKDRAKAQSFRSALITALTTKDPNDQGEVMQTIKNWSASSPLVQNGSVSSSATLDTIFNELDELRGRIKKAEDAAAAKLLETNTKIEESRAKMNELRDTIADQYFIPGKLTTERKLVGYSTSTLAIGGIVGLLAMYTYMSKKAKRSPGKQSAEFAVFS